MEAEREDLLRQLADRVHLRAEEQSQFFAKLEAKETELRHARREVRLLERRLAHADASQAGQHVVDRSALLGRVTGYVTAPPRRALFAQGGQLDSLNAARGRFRQVERALPKQFLLDLERLGFFVPGDGLTKGGARWLWSSLVDGAQQRATEEGRE